MKKTLVRIVALLLMAVMVLSVIPAFASGFVGTLASATNLYKKANTSSEVIATVQGSVSILYQNNEGTMYQITVTKDGKTYTGWVPASAVSNIGRSGTTTGSTTTTTTTTTGTYSGTLAAETSVYNDSNKLVGTVKGKVTVNYRNAAGTQIHITATDGVNTISGWVPASAVSGLYSRNSGSIKVDKLPTSGAGSSAVADAAYTKYPTAKTGVSTDSTIYMRPKAEKSTSGATKIRSAKGLSFTLLGESGDYYYASYNGSTGFVRKQDFTVTTGTTTPGTTPAPGTTTTGVQKPTTTYPKAKAATSNDRTIYMRYKPDKSTEKENVVLKVTGARGASFSLIGESGDWYLARYTQNGQTYEGYVRKQDFTVTEAVAGATTTSTTTSGAASVGSGSSSEKWGSIAVPGGSTYTIYGNYTNAAGNIYYYDYSNIGSYNYIHTTTAKGSQIQVVMGHNMRSSKTMFHRLHHVQNAILGAGSCEGCGGSCGSSYNTTTISASLDGYSKWDIMCFYEIPKGSSTSILEYNARPWNTSTQSYVNYQLQYAKTSGYKGWVNPAISYSNNGKYMMLITCGDKYESSSNATSKLYMLLKARG